MTLNKKITREQLNGFAESSVKVTSCSNASKLFYKLLKCSDRTPGVNDLAMAIENALYDATACVATYNPETEQETRTQCIDALVNAISNTLNIKYREEKGGKRGSSSITDYLFEETNNGLTTKFVIEAKKLTNKIFNSRNEIDATKASQCAKYMSTSSNGHGYSVVLLTNGRNMALFIDGVVNCKNSKNTNWQPLRDTTKPILTLSCYSISKEACKVLSYIIIQTLKGNENRVLECIRDVYESEVDTLETEFTNRGIVII